jgi:hypothetical protein
LLAYIGASSLSDAFQCPGQCIALENQSRWSIQKPLSQELLVLARPTHNLSLVVFADSSTATLFHAFGK